MVAERSVRLMFRPVLRTLSLFSNLAPLSRKLTISHLLRWLVFTHIPHSNAVIGADHKRAIECRGPCTIRNVWFENVCDQAVVLRQSSGASLITGGGVKRSPDVVVQHNGGGSVKIESYCAQDFGRLYKSCSNCATQVKREVQISNVIAGNGKLLAGVNSNYGDVATIDTATNSYTSLTSVCDTFRGTSSSSSEALRLTQNQSNAK
jgi:hypothetical protein